MSKKVIYENSLEYLYPEVAKEWHPIKNGTLRPTDVCGKSNKKVWWYLPYDDPDTGEHFDFEWEVAIIRRTGDGVGCPYLSNQRVWVGYNDLATKFPKIASEWHPTKNGNLKPTDFTHGSEKRVWWYLPYDDPATGKHFDFEWEATINTRTSGKGGCPYITGKKVWPGYNDFESNYPEIAKMWHPTKNGNLKPNEVRKTSNKTVWWYLPYDDPDTGEHFDFEWTSKISNMVKSNGTCPFIARREVWPGYNDLASKYPKLALEWHPTKNGGLGAEDVLRNSNKKVWWYLPYDDPDTGEHFDFEWQEAVYNRVNHGHGCPFLSNHKAWPGYNDLATKFPEIAKDWHPTKNKKLSPDKVLPKSTARVWWKCSVCGYEWNTSIAVRVCGNSNCKMCRKNRVCREK